MPKKEYCCETAEQQLTNVCKDHGIVCPDNVLREYKPGVFGIPHPDMDSYYLIQYCPWCGTKLSRILWKRQEKS